MNIKVLAPEVVAQIAAGEVIERPASVVKELIENSVDAGAGHIKVEIEEGGRRLIRVSDDGAGIPAVEAELAFVRHATSKLSRVEDLAEVRTLGFRGEALTSIAAVADVEMLTRAVGEELGTYLRLEKGQLVAQEARSSPQGTRVTVEWLFRRLPARRKFLRSVDTELVHIADLVSRYALAYPSIRFDLENEGRLLFSSAGSGRLWDVLVAAYGLEVARQMLPLESGDGPLILEGVEVVGFISPPNLHRSSRRYVTFLLNGRYIKDRMLNYALEAPYEGSLPRGRHPIAVIVLRMNPRQVDVNVHPAKLEVRFQQPRHVFTLVERSVREVLLGKGHLSARARQVGDRVPLPRLPQEVARWERGRLGMEVQRTGEVALPPQMELPKEKLPILRVMGQVAGSYIVAEGPEGLYMIDQHAAHERILYERLLVQAEAKEPISQVLLEPELVELGPADSAVLEAQMEHLEAMGFGLEPFGGRLWRVRKVPSGMRTEDLQGTLSAILGEQQEASPGPQEGDGELLRSVACHGAVKAGQKMTFPEMQALVRDLEETQMPLTCPHGRPTVIKFTMDDLAREFERT